MKNRRFRKPWCDSTPRKPGKRPPLPYWLRDGRDLSGSSDAVKTSYRYHRKIWQATPPWMNDDLFIEMRKIYEAATREQHVDHIVPLRHPLVCGLHVPWNLRRVHWRENLTKGNRHWPDDPYELHGPGPDQPDFFYDDETGQLWLV